MKRKNVLLFLGLIVFALMMTACGNKPIVSDPDTKDKETTEKSEPKIDKKEADDKKDEPKSEGNKIVSVAISKPWDSMMPLNTNSNYSRFVYDQLYDRLFMSKADGEYEPRLAKSWSVNEDSSAITFKLAENVKWHDGEPFTAADVVFSFEMYSNPEIDALSRYHLQYIKGVDASGVKEGEGPIGVSANGDYEVTFEFKKPMYFGSFMNDLDTVFIIPKHIFEGKTPQEINAPELWAKAIGTGPFKYDSEISGERMELVKNPDYFQGAPEIDRLVVRVVDSTSLLANLMSKDVDINVLGAIPLQDWSAAEEEKDIETISVPSTNYTMLIINSEKPYMTKPVRQAINMALNRDVYVNSLYQGEAEAIVTPIASISPYYDKKVDIWFDQAKAAQILKDENFPFDETLKFYTSAGGDNQRLASLIVQDLEAVGLKVEIIQSDFTKLMQDMREGAHDFGTIGSGGSMDPGESREMIAVDSAVNFSHVKETLLSDKIDEGNSKLQFDERKVIFDQYQEMVKDESVIAYLFTKNNLVGYNPKLENVKVEDFGNLNWKTWTWKVQ